MTKSPGLSLMTGHPLSRCGETITSLALMLGAGMNKVWEIWKHALGSFSDEQTRGQDDMICAVRTVIVCTNLLCALFIMANIVRHW